MKGEADPFYLYDSEKIRAQCARFKAIPYPEKKVHFATMANIHPRVLEYIKAEGLGVFVNSLIHLKQVQKAGFDSKSIIFTASGLSPKIMRHIQEEKIQVNLDSVGQLEQWERLFANSEIGLRCNIGDQINPKETHAGFFLGSQSRLGLSIEELNRIKRNPRIKGLHVYVGTDIMDVEYFISCYEKLCQLVDLFPNLEYLNFGGGFGIKENAQDSFPMKEYGHRVTELMERVSTDKKKNIRLILEPGRIITSGSGYFVCSVTDVKVRGSKTFIGVNASSVQFPRPLMYPETAKHPIAIIRNGRQLSSTVNSLSAVCGCSTYSRDYLLDNVDLPPIDIGDTLVLGNAGAYSASSYTEFLGFTKPKEFFI